MSKDSQLISYDQIINKLVSKFSPDSRGIDKPAIINWLKQFSEKDIGLAVKILEKTIYCDPVFINYGCRNIYNQFQSNTNNNHHEFYCGLGTFGSSGSSLVRPFRITNNLRRKSFDGKFKSMSDLSNLPRNSSILLIEDFIGSGDQVLSYAQHLNDLMIPEETDIYLGVIIAYEDSVRKIESQTNFSVLTHRILRKKHNIFSPNCKMFTSREKEIIINYCKRTRIRDCLGYKDNGLLVVFFDSTPNNTIGILRSNSDSFEGLFPRDDYNL